MEISESMIEAGKKELMKCHEIYNSYYWGDIRESQIEKLAIRVWLAMNKEEKECDSRDKY